MATGDDTLMEAAVTEYWLKHPMEDTNERIGRRSALRGLMVRLGLYDEFTRVLEEHRVNHAAKSRQETLDSIKDT